MGILSQIGEYLNLKKKDAGPVRDDQYADDRWSIKYVKSMHKINRLSIFLFLIAIVIIIVKLIVANR